MNLEGVTKGVKIFQRDDGDWAVQNPYFHKSSGTGIPKELKNSPVWENKDEATNALADQYGVQVVHFSHDKWNVSLQKDRRVKVTVVTEHGTGLATNRTAW